MQNHFNLNIYLLCKYVKVIFGVDSEFQKWHPDEALSQNWPYNFNNHLEL